MLALRCCFCHDTVRHSGDSRFWAGPPVDPAREGGVGVDMRLAAVRSLVDASAHDSADLSPSSRSDGRC